MPTTATHLKKPSRKISLSLKIAFASLLTLAMATPVYAGVFSVAPVRIYMTPKDRAVAVTITNGSDEDLVMQADIYVWKQKPGGEDDLVLSEDMLLAPPIIKMAKKSRQVVRLARLHPVKSDQQLTYRMIVREIPEAQPVNDQVQLQVALAFSMPVFITPPGAKSKLTCGVERTAANSVHAVCENSGSAYAQPLNFILTNSTGKTLASRDTGGYILPGINRNFNITSADQRIPGGKATLTVKLDDGTERGFDVLLAE